MNKKTLLSIAVASLFAIGGVFYNTTQEEKEYSPRVKAEEGIAGYEEYLKTIRANQETGVVSDADVKAVQAEIKNQSNVKFKADWPLTWEFRGPDNIGGRTRCLVIDKDDPKVLYSGGVSGAVFKSTNGGGSWRPLTIGADNFGIVSMAQNDKGEVFYGTGEAGLTSATGGENGTAGFNGMGIFKSTDGETFSSLNGTSVFGSIYMLTVDPTTDYIYAGSSNGLRVSKDDGASWTLVRGGSCRDIQFNSNGVALASIGNGIWRSTSPDEGSSYSNITAIGNNTRSGIAWSESDPNYVYVVTVGSEVFDGQTYGGGALSGLFRSTDGGVTFTEEVDKISQFFAPFTIIGLQAQGDYDLAIGVHPRNKDRVFIGGIAFAEWSLQDGPKIVGNNFRSPTNPFGIHSDKHLIKFDNSGTDPIMYVCSDGGIARTTNADLDRYRDISTNLSTTQFYAVDADVNGRLLGGTQDNNTMLLRGESFPRQIAEDVIGGDGFQTAISKYDPNFMFGESQYGNLRRSITGGGSFETIWDNRITASHSSATRPTNYFNNALALWENPQILAELETRDKVDADDSLINAKLYFAADDGVWVCNNALAKPHDPDNPKDFETVRWHRISTVRNVHYLKPTVDGKSLFIATRGGTLWRVDNLLTANYDTNYLASKTDAIDTLLTETNITGNLNIGGRTVTSVALDKNDPNRLVLTAGNYNNTNFVFVTDSALSTSPTWSSIQGNLPRFPVYHAIISADDPDIVVLGTEFGIWATQNGTSASPTWAEALEGKDSELPFPRVPVFDLVQVESKSWTGPRIYAATHGMGLWESKSLLTSVKKDDKEKLDVASVTAYPNPANNFVNIRTSIKGRYVISVYNMNGAKLFTDKGTNNGTIKLSTADFTNGNYFVEVIGDGSKAVSKIIVQH